MPRFEFNVLKLPDLKDRLSGSQYQQLKGDILALMFTQRTRTFDRQQGPEGPWKKLKKRQAKKRFNKLPAGAKKQLGNAREALRTGAVKLLQDDRVLLKSFTIPGSPQQETSIIGDKVSLATNVEYARIHNLGGTIKHPGTQNGFGRGIFIKPHNINIPQRQYDHFTTQDVQEIRELIDSYLNEPQGAFA